MHLDIVLSLHDHVDLPSPGPPAFVCNENSNQSDSDYKSDYWVQIADCRAVRSEIDDTILNHSDTEDVSQPPVCRGPSSQSTISGAGRTLSDVAAYTKLNRTMTDEPLKPFLSHDDFNLASWLVWRKVAKSQIDTYFAEALGNTDRGSFRSASTMRQHLDVLDPFGGYLVWTEGVRDDGQDAATFYYQNIIDCVHYLIRQVAYSSDMVYAPIG